MWVEGRLGWEAEKNFDGTYNTLTCKPASLDFWSWDQGRKNIWYHFDDSDRAQRGHSHDGQYCSRSNRVCEVLHNLEWFFTIVFAIEYILRLVATLRPWRYALSIFGLIDLLAILPSLIIILFPGFQYLLVIRVFRIIRILRIFEFLDYLREWTMLLKALQASQARIMAFLFSILIAVTFLGALMYVVEGEKAGFTSIQRSIYWQLWLCQLLVTVI